LSPRVDTAFLANFLLVVDAGSMSEAARRLDLTPAAVAQQVRALERELGVPLLTRAGRTVAPTDAGRRLVERVRGLVRDVADLKSYVNDEHIGGELRLGCINTALHSLVPGILAHFVKAHPAVRVYIESGLSRQLYEAVQGGDLDAAVCLHPRFALPKTLAWEQLREERMILLVPAKLARREPHELLLSEPLIRYDRALGGGKQADRYLRRAGIAPQERFELTSLVAIAMMVDRGLGVSLVPDIASPLWAGLRIARIALPLETEPRRFGVLWQRAALRARLISEFVSSARRAGGR
jgi:DNA-binding transcriptional LysR family regulator